MSNVTVDHPGSISQLKKIDFFISRTGKDSDIAILIARFLQEVGATTLLQDEDFGHTSFMAMMAKGWSSGARLICVLSPDYQKSEHCKSEYEVALTKDPRNINERIIVLRIAECDPIEHLAPLPYTDLVPILHDASEFALIVRGAVGLETDQGEADLTALHRRAPKQIVHRNVGPNSNFTGRQEHLDHLNTALSAGQTAALTNTGHAAALAGLGGIGKTVLAREFAWQNRECYQGVWWVRAEARDTLLDDLIDLGSHFIPGLKTVEDREAAAQSALDHIWQGNYAKPWLIVYDNVEKPDNLEHLKPRGGTHILITTRWPDWLWRGRRNTGRCLP